MSIFLNLLKTLQYFLLWRARSEEFKLKDYANDIIDKAEDESDELEKQIDHLRSVGRDCDADELRKKHARRAIYLQSAVSLRSKWDSDQDE